MKIIFEVTKVEFNKMMKEAEDVSDQEELEELLLDDMENIYSEMKMEVKIRIL